MLEGNATCGICAKIVDEMGWCRMFHVMWLLTRLSFTTTRAAEMFLTWVRLRIADPDEGRAGALSSHARRAASANQQLELLP